MGRIEIGEKRRQARRTLEALGLERIEWQLEDQRQVYFAGVEGPLLVLLHGAGDQAGTWVEVAPALLERYRLLIPDLIGHGDSEPGEGPLQRRREIAIRMAIGAERFRLVRGIVSAPLGFVLLGELAGLLGLLAAMAMIAAVISISSLS